MVDRFSKYTLNRSIMKHLYRGNDEKPGGTAPKVMLRDRFTDEPYMLKLQKRSLKNKSNYNDHIAEFIGSNIIQLIGYESQNAYLVWYNNNTAVLIKMFDNKLIELKNTLSYFYNMDERYLDLDSILEGYRIRSNKTNIDEDRFKKFLIRMLIVDYLIVNIDRHPGNIGFFRENGILVPAPFYDSGASLLTRYFDSNYEEMIESHKIVNYKVLINGKRISFGEVLKILSREIGSNEFYKEEINYALKNYDNNKEEIYKIIDCIKTLGDKYEESAERIKELLEFTTTELKSLINNESEDLNLSWSMT